MGDFGGECEIGNYRDRTLKLGIGVVSNDTDNQHLAKEVATKSSSGDDKVDKGKERAKWFIIAAISSFIFGCILFNLNEHLHLRQPLIFLAFVFFSFVSAPLLGIVACISLLKAKTTSGLGCVFSILLIPVLSVIFLIAGRLFIVGFLPYVYTPPAITSNDLAVYKECIQFVKNHDKYKNMRIGWGLLFDSHKRIEAQDETIEIKALCNRLYGIRCVKLQRDNNMVLFYKMAKSVLPGFPPGFLSVMPERPGVLYSLKGKKPNEIDSEVLNAAKPFTRIYGNWYMSRHLMLAGPRSDIPDSIPESLIDCSLQIDGIDPNELRKFD